MRVMVFTTPGYYCFTPNLDGSNLPELGTEWNSFKIDNLNRGVPSRVFNVDSDKAIDAIEETGFYLIETSQDNA